MQRAKLRKPPTRSSFLPRRRYVTFVQMPLTVQPYTVTAADATAIAGYGYTISGLAFADLPDFLNKEYPNFNLLKMVQVVETVMVPTSTLPVRRALIIAGSKLTIQVNNRPVSEADEMCFIRTFSNGSGAITVSHDYLIFPANAQQLQYAKQVFQVCLQEYVSMGLQKIFVFAGLQGGAYVWARHGFVAIDQKEVDRILRFAHTRVAAHEMAALKGIYDWYYGTHPSGQAFPIKLWADMPFMKKVLMNNNLTWHGMIDLTDKEQNANFMMYVFRP